MSDKKFVNNANTTDSRGYKGSLGMKKPTKLSDSRLKSKSKTYLVGPAVGDPKFNIVYPSCVVSSNISNMDPGSDSNSKSMLVQNLRKADFDSDSEARENVALPSINNVASVNSVFSRDIKNVFPYQKTGEKYRLVNTSKPTSYKNKVVVTNTNVNSNSNTTNTANTANTASTPMNSNGKFEIRHTQQTFEKENKDSLTNLHTSPSYMGYTSNSYMKTKLGNTNSSLHQQSINSSNANIQGTRMRDPQKQTFSYGQVSTNHSFYTKPKSVNKAELNNFSNSNDYNKTNTGVSNPKKPGRIVSNKSLNLNIPNDQKVMTIQSNINYNLNLQNFKMGSLNNTTSNINEHAGIKNSTVNSSNYNMNEKERKPTNLKININKIKDDRKFSILDIPSGVSQLVKSDASKLAFSQQGQAEKQIIEEQDFKEERYLNPEASEQYCKADSSQHLQKINFNKDDVYDFFLMNSNSNNTDKQKQGQQMRMGNHSNNPNYNNNYNNYYLNKEDQIRVMNSNSNSYMQAANTTGGHTGNRSEAYKESGNFNSSNLHNRNVYMSTNFSNIPPVGYNNFNTNTSASGFSNNAIPHFLLNNSITHSNNINPNDESQLYQSLVSDIQQGRKGTHKLKKEISSIKNTTLKAFTIMLESDLLTPNARLKIVTQVKPIYDICKDTLLRDYISGLVKSVKQLDEKYHENVRLKLRDEAINWTYKATSTTQLSLNHLSKKFDQKLCTLRPKHKEIEAIFRLILVLFNVNESYSSEHTLLTVYSKFKINSLSKFNY